MTSPRDAIKAAIREQEKAKAKPAKEKKESK